MENNGLVKADIETTEVLNNFSSDLVQNLDISMYSNDEPHVNCMKDSTLQVLLNDINYSNIVAIRNKCKCFVVVHKK